MFLDISSVKENILCLMKEWNVPGLSVGIIDTNGSNTTLSFGTRDLRDNNKFNSDTLVPIGCCTKAFTSLAIGILAEKNLLTFDDKIKKHLKDIAFYSQLLTNNLTIKDILCMRTGIQIDEIIYNESNYTCDDILNKIRFITPSICMREYFLYDIFLYNLLKKIICINTQISWEEFIISELASPIGMKNICFTYDYIKSTNYAIGYYEKEGNLIPENNLRNINAVLPSAGINTSSRELLNWLYFLINGFSSTSQRIVSQPILNDIFRPYIFSKAYPTYKELYNQSYALGWFNEPYKGNNLFYHEGNVRGYSTLVSILPEKKIGITILMNKDRCPLTRILLYNFIDNILGLEKTNWSKRFKRERLIKQSINYNNSDNNQLLNFHTVLHNGVYTNKFYGLLIISQVEQSIPSVTIFNKKFVLCSYTNNWFIFFKDSTSIFIKYENSASKIYAKFSKNAKPIEFIRIA